MRPRRHHPSPLASIGRAAWLSWMSPTHGGPGDRSGRRRRRPQRWPRQRLRIQRRRGRRRSRPGRRWRRWLWRRWRRLSTLVAKGRPAPAKSTRPARVPVDLLVVLDNSSSTLGSGCRRDTSGRTSGPRGTRGFLRGSQVCRTGSGIAVLPGGGGDEWQDVQYGHGLSGRRELSSTEVMPKSGETLPRRPGVYTHPPDARAVSSRLHVRRPGRVLAHGQGLAPRWVSPAGPRWPATSASRRAGVAGWTLRASIARRRATRPSLSRSRTSPARRCRWSRRWKIPSPCSVRPWPLHVAGALAHAREHQAANPTHRVAMVLATDGLPRPACHGR